MNIENKKSYTIEELKLIAGGDYVALLSTFPVFDKSKYNKPIVYSYNDFDSNTKAVYSSLYTLISGLNPSTNFLLFALGSRVIGKWLSPSDVEEINLENNIVETTSPYEYWCDANRLPTSTELGEINSDAAIVYNLSNKTHRVIIPRP